MFTCPCCGENRDESEMCFGIAAPDHFASLPISIQSISLLTDDQCIVGDEHYFVRGSLEIPIQGTSHCISWSVWVSLSGQNFERMSEMWDRPERESEPPYFAWFGNSLPEYPETLNLKALLHTRPVGVRPLIELEPTEHPLSVEQRVGISPARAHELMAKLLPKTGRPAIPPPTNSDLGNLRP
jgi:hypothetical protein